MLKFILIENWAEYDADDNVLNMSNDAVLTTDNLTDLVRAAHGRLEAHVNDLAWAFYGEDERERVSFEEQYLSCANWTNLTELEERVKPTYVMVSPGHVKYFTLVSLDREGSAHVESLSYGMLVVGL